MAALRDREEKLVQLVRKAIREMDEEWDRLGGGGEPTGGEIVLTVNGRHGSGTTRIPFDRRHLRVETKRSTV